MMAKREISKRPTPSGVPKGITDCNSPILQKRLQRIAENYDALESLLVDLESQVPEIPEPPDEPNAPPNLPR